MAFLCLDHCAHIKMLSRYALQRNCGTFKFLVGKEIFGNIYANIIEKGIRIEYPYNYGLPHGNSAFVTIWLDFDLLVRKIVQI